VSQYEDTAVDDLDLSNMSDAEVKDIADNDTRTTAQEKAQAEQNRREKDDGDTDTSDAVLSLSPSDPKERAEANGLNVDGMNFDPDFGQVKLQKYQQEIEKSGTIPPTGSPPDDSLTVSEVVKQEEAEKERRMQYAEDSAAGKIEP
jgi:hypothetical protein